MTNQAELIKEMIQAIEYAEESAIYDTYGRANLSALVKVKRKALELLKGHENDWESTQAAKKTTQLTQLSTTNQLAGLIVEASKTN